MYRFVDPVDLRVTVYACVPGSAVFFLLLSLLVRSDEGR